MKGEKSEAEAVLSGEDHAGADGRKPCAHDGGDHRRAEEIRYRGAA